jgi:hypothetical protein
MGNETANNCFHPTATVAAAPYASGEASVSHRMNSDDREEINEAIRAAMRKARGYADFFGWATNRDLRSKVSDILAESLERSGSLFFSSVAIRGRGQDPPDLEARDQAAAHRLRGH